MIALCAIGRLENLYAREWVDYHLALGFDRIVIYDNNRDGEESFEDVLEEPVREGYVEVINYRGRENAHIDAYNDCYKRYGQACEWIAFLDFDEFLVCEQPLQTFLSNYAHADCVLVNWRVMTDSGLLLRDPRPVRERFTVPLSNKVLMRGKYRYNDHVKSIVHGGLNTMIFHRNNHVPSSPMRCCTTDGRVALPSAIQGCNHEIARIDHYTTKTLDEWLNLKYQRGFAYPNTKRWREKIAIPQFFEINQRTPEKEAFLQEWLRSLTNFQNATKN